MLSSIKPQKNPKTHIKFKIQMIYANFFSPPTISMLFCLHESTVEGEQKDPRNKLVEFLIKKILTITDACSQCKTNSQFKKQMLDATRDQQFLTKYNECIKRISNFNDFYRQISKMLKTLRSLRNNKLEQGNLIDFLIRRMYIYFQKLDFKEIIKLYENFNNFTNDVPVNPSQHQFMLTKSIEEIKFNLENYNCNNNPEIITKKVDELRAYDHTNKSTYLYSLVKAEQNNPIQAISSIHRYFDKSLGNLFQQKSEVSLMSNKINHCILSNAFVNLKMHYLEECLQSISQGLRISQNNSDQESINNCIIYLYRISEQLGRYEEQILLNQHAITHSLNLSNIVLMVYSCLNYSLFQRKYNCQDPNILLMKNRNISWTDALHFSKKKVHSTFESNCKNIYHSFRSLLIPTFMCKLAVLAHLPQLKSLLINPYYQREELFQLEVYQQHTGATPLQKLFKQTLQYCRCQQTKLLQRQMHKLKQHEESALSPLEIIQIRTILNKVKLEGSSFQGGHGEAERHAEFCQKYGFVKDELLQIWMISIRILIEEGMNHDAIVKVQQVLKHCIDQKLKQFQIVVSLLGIQARLHLSYDISQALLLLEEVQQQSNLLNIREEFKATFFETKILAYNKLYEQLIPQINFYDECQEIKRNQFVLLESWLKLELQAKNVVRVRSILFKMYDILLLNQDIISKPKNEKVKSTLNYCQKVLNIYSTIDIDTFDEDELLNRVITKLTATFFN